MAEIDYVIPEITITKEGIIDLQELYSLLKKHLIERKYDLEEKKHDVKEGSFEIKWASFKKVDDYTKFNIDLGINGSNIKEIKLKKVKAFSGNFKIKFESYLGKDYEDSFENNPILKFFRTLYDNFILRDKFNQYNKELKDETYAIYNEVKAYLNIKKLE
ncbi:MAG: hypothetical protein KJ674_05215 [Nanoarchaeota archaeon]|nr:hypothetical protein [Nanoarchaeota archaeon]